MFDKEDIQHNLKTGADSDIMFTREVTDKKSEQFNKLKTKDGIYKYPYLSRSTGNSIKGTTDMIESNELRKGRTKSAPRKGNSSAEGSLDIELSPSTFDDNLAAAFRNEWKPWKSDTDSAINLDHTACPDGYFITRCLKDASNNENDYNTDESFGTRRLLNIGGADPDGLIEVPAGCIVHELTCGTEDIKYSVLKKFGGVTDEDLYQEYRHMAVNTLSLDVQIGAIVTGSFGFMGNNNPELLTEEKTRANFGGTSTNRFADGKTTGNDYIDNLPVKSTDTDQFTSREGNLWIDGKNITFAESLSMELNNGLEKKYAIFVKNAISTQPLSLDVTGEIKTYLVHGESDELYNLGVNDATNEIVFCFQDKEYDPTFLYIFQIFKTKIGDQDLSSSGADTFSQTHPYNSFEERAVRVFRVALPKPVSVEFKPASVWTDAGSYTVTPNVPVEATDIEKITAVVTLKNEAGEAIATQTINGDTATVTEEGYIELPEVTFQATSGMVTDGQIRDIEVTLNDTVVKQSFGVTESDEPGPVKQLTAFPNNKKVTLVWNDPADTDLAEIELDIVKGDKIVYSDKVAKGVKKLDVTKLSNGTKYTVNAYAVDENDNKSKVATTTFTPVENVQIVKDIAGLEYTDEAGSNYKFDNVNGVAKHCQMDAYNFDFAATDGAEGVCYVRCKDYAKDTVIVYGYTGDVGTTLTLTIKDPTQQSSEIPETITLTKVVP